MRLAVNLSKVTLKKSEESVTGKMGLSWLAHSMEHFGVWRMVVDEYGQKKNSNCEVEAYRKIMAGVLMKVAGGRQAEDVEVLRADEGLLCSLGWKGMIGADTLLNFIEDKRTNARMRRVNDAMVIKAMREADNEEFTYDNDATFIDSDKKSAAYSYQGIRQFSGLMGCVTELGLINTVDYRPGNVSPQTGILNQLRKAVGQAQKAGKKIVRFRSDSAGYQVKILGFCDSHGIEYYVTADKNAAVMKRIKQLKAYEWRAMHERYARRVDVDWAEMSYVVSKGFRVRMLVLRWKNPDPTLFDASPYCYHVIVTNNKEIRPMAWLEVHNGRMGTIEQAHKELKTGLGCDYTPSHDFEKNRGYFLLGVLAHNMCQIMKRFYLMREAADWTVKTLRYRFIYVCGKIVKTGRRFYCRMINVTNGIFELFRYCQERMRMGFC